MEKNAQLLKEFFRQFLLALILRAREAIWIIGHPRCLFCRSFSLSLSLCLVPAALAGLCSDTSGCQIMSIINAILGCYLPSPSSTAIASYQPYGHRFQHTSSNNNGEQEIPDKDHKKQWNIFKFEEILKLSKKILSPPFSTND